MKEMTDAGEAHRDPQFVGPSDHIGVLFAASGLHDSAYPGRSGRFDAVGEREESVASKYRTPRGPAGTFQCEANGLDPVHLTGPYA